MAAAGDPNFPASGLQIKPSNHAKSSGGEWDVFDSAEDIASYGIAGRVWEAAYAARRYFSEAAEAGGSLELDPVSSLFHPDSLHQQLTVLELGAGAGYGGLHLCKCIETYRNRMAGSTSSTKGQVQVLLTDLPNVQPLLDRNVARTREADPSLAQSIAIQAWPCAWGDKAHVDAILQHLCNRAPSSSARPRPALSHILAADLVYFPELFPPLLRSLIWLTEPSSLLSARTAAPVPVDDVDAAGSPILTPEVIFTYKVRSLVKEQPFWAVFGAWFSFEAVLCRSTRSSDSAAAGEGRPTEQPSWRRFGERTSDVQSRRRTTVPLPVSAESSVSGAEDDESDQQIYVFLARRKVHTFGWRAPDEDTALMDGRREQWNIDGEGVQTVTELDDTFEMLLLNSIGL
ncbi:hypothetical protein OC835_000772 [Tilletia horrida]|nr:hypothetical protein OC835_000772 [Tilletia horrida]